MVAFPPHRRPVASPGQAPGEAVAGGEHRRRPHHGAGPRSLGRPEPLRPRPRPHRPAVPRRGEGRHGRAVVAVPAGRVLAARPRRHQGPLRRDATQAARRRGRRGRGGRRPTRRWTSPRPSAPPATIPDRHIYTLDLRDSNKHEAFVAEIRRIAAECRERREAKAREKAANSPAIVQLGLSLRTPTRRRDRRIRSPAFAPEALLAPAGRRWYPVIDYSRCTNCLECLDFCLFGVYGVDSLERIVVENQDQCKKGCPACSRVCPEQAIMFPEYKSAAIAGRRHRRGRRAEDRPEQAVRRRRRRRAGRGRAGARPRTGQRRPGGGRHDGRHPEAAGGQAAGAEGRPRQARGRPGNLGL